MKKRIRSKEVERKEKWKKGRNKQRKEEQEDRKKVSNEAE